MGKIRKLTCAICMAAAILILAGAWLQANPTADPDDYTSVHPSSTMVPLTGFAADALVNAGDAAALDMLPGVGEVIAQRIIETRMLLGGFRLPEDLLLVKGIGEKTLEKMMGTLEESIVTLQEIAD